MSTWANFRIPLRFAAVPAGRLGSRLVVIARKGLAIIPGFIPGVHKIYFVSLDFSAQGECSVVQRLACGRPSGHRHYSVFLARSQSPAREPVRAPIRSSSAHSFHFVAPAYASSRPGACQSFQVTRCFPCLFSPVRDGIRAMSRASASQGSAYRHLHCRHRTTRHRGMGNADL